jgi:hypothetical protein
VDSQLLTHNAAGLWEVGMPQEIIGARSGRPGDPVKARGKGKPNWHLFLK